jgi:hypothetical protein
MRDRRVHRVIVWIFLLKPLNKFYKLLKHSNSNCMTHWMLDCVSLQMASKIFFVVFKGHWIEYRRGFLWRIFGMNIINKCMFGMILRLIVMIGIWIIVISGMTTTSIFIL